MKSLIVLCAFAAVLAAQPQEPPPSAPRKPKPTVTPLPPLPAPVEIVTAAADLRGDGAVAHISIRMTDGRRYTDTELWCGGGGRDKFEGTFEICVAYPERPAVCTPLNPLLTEPIHSIPAQPTAPRLWFRAEPWTIEFADYNHDGRLDFTLGQYGGCGGWGYTLLTIDPDGTVRRLLHDPIYLWGAGSNSVALSVTPTGFHYSEKNERDRWVCYEYESVPPKYELRLRNVLAVPCAE
jgi:hypothetical protein